MFGFNNLASEVKDRFIKDRFWSAVFVSLVICNWRVFLILASDLKYAEKIAVIEFSLIENAWVSFVIAFSVATFRTFVWPFCSKGIEYYLFRIKEAWARKETLFASQGVIDVRNVLVLIDTSMRKRSDINIVCNRLLDYADAKNDEELRGFIRQINAHNRALFPGIDETCKSLGIDSDDLTTLVSIISPTPESGYKKLTKENFIKFYEGFKGLRSLIKKQP